MHSLFDSGRWSRGAVFVAGMVALLACVSTTGCGRPTATQDAGRADPPRPADAATAEALFKEMRVLVEERQQARARGDAKRVEEIEGQIARHQARLATLPAADVERVRVSLGAELFREMDQFAAAWMLGTRPDLGPGMPRRLEPLWQDIFDARRAAGPDAAKQPPPPVPVEIESRKLDLALALARQHYELIADIERLQGLLWGAEEDRVFRGDYKQDGFAQSRPYEEWCRVYRRGIISPSSTAVKSYLTEAQRIADRSRREQATPEDQRELDRLIEDQAGSQGLRAHFTLDEVEAVARRLLQDHHLHWQDRENLQQLHDRVSTMPGYTGKVGQPR